MGKKTTKTSAPSVAPVPKDLVVVAADKDAEFTIRGLLSRWRVLNIRELRPEENYKIFVLPEHDAGCRVRADEFLRSQQRQYAHALVVFDQEGCGQENCPPQQLEAEVEARLANAGWQGRSAVIVLHPELEIWVWSQSPHVAIVLGWQHEEVALLDWLGQQGFMASGQSKPARPKRQCLLLYEG